MEITRLRGKAFGHTSRKEEGREVDSMEPTVHHPKCMICEQQKEQGIMILSEFICDDCEAEMVHTDVKDEKYPFFIRQMRRISLKMDA